METKSTNTYNSLLGTEHMLTDENEDECEETEATEEIIEINPENDKRPSSTVHRNNSVFPNLVFGPAPS